MGSTQAAPLHTISPWPVAVGGKPDWLVTPTGKVRCATWPAAKPSEARGTIMLAHGLSEQIEKYQSVVAKLTERNFSVAMTDWRGHGLSDNCPQESKEDFNVRDADLAFFMERHVIDKKMPQPIIGMGHSFGGCMMCCAMHDNPDWFAGGILCSPMLGIHILAKHLPLQPILSLLHFVRPYFMRKKPDVSSVQRYTSDVKRFAQHQDFLDIHPELRPKFDFLFWVGSAQKRLRQMNTDWYKEIKLPMLLIIAEEENLVDNKAIKRACKAMPKAHFAEIEGAWHEILAEQDHIQAKLWSEVDKFLDKIAPAEKTT